MKLLVVEDDASLGEILCDRLRESEYEVTWAKTLAEAKEAFSGWGGEIAILDVNLPDGSGFELAKWMRDQRYLSLVFLTAMNTAENRLMGYEIGAEEYIPKPFHFRELLLRLDHVKANHLTAKSVECPVGEIRLNEQVIVTKEGETLTVSKKDFDVLKYLIERSPAVVSRDEILNQIWGEDQFPSTRTIDNCIVRLRQVLKDANAEWIRSVRGVGYLWVGGQHE